ncbi:MAG: fumarylacetoacetase [Gammaproteobacteria bacterium]|nr:fumarylacetoacetase [Gammaproteobacteria bacterium]
MQLNETHDAGLRSWVASANSSVSDFPIQNLPFGIFRKGDSNESFRAGVAIGDQILDLAAAHKAGVFGAELDAALASLASDELNGFMAMGADVWSALRLQLSRLLRSGAQAEQQLNDCLLPQSDAQMKLPARIGDYTDFYTSIHHATNVGKLFRPDNPLLPNYQWVPIGYHGRSSSIDISGQTFPRPYGQLKAPDADAPVLAPCKRLDYELEVGIYIGEGNAPGTRISMQNAEQHVFGLCLFNDWSARDIQAWEYQPLGPFLSKSFASTVSPWIVTLEALAPYRLPWSRPDSDPQPLPYLDSAELRESGAVDMQLEVLIQTPSMQSPERLAQSNFSHSYWSISQMVAHHSVNGCNLKPGDLFGSGTLSGPDADSVGALLEATEGGKNPITLSNGEQRTFVEDGDTIILRGWCGGDDRPRIGFGEASATVLPAEQA